MMGFVVISESEQGRLGQRNQSIFRALTAVDVNQHSLGVDVANLEIEGFLEPEAQGVDDREEAQHGWLFDELKKRVNLADRNHDRQLEFTTRSNESESCPGSRAGNREVLFETLLCDVDSA